MSWIRRYKPDYAYKNYVIDYDNLGLLLPDELLEVYKGAGKRMERGRNYFIECSPSYISPAEQRKSESLYQLFRLLAPSLVQQGDGYIVINNVPEFSRRLNTSVNVGSRLLAALTDGDFCAKSVAIENYGWDMAIYISDHPCNNVVEVTAKNGNIEDSDLLDITSDKSELSLAVLNSYVLIKLDPHIESMTSAQFMVQMTRGRLQEDEFEYPENIPPEVGENLEELGIACINKQTFMSKLSIKPVREVFNSYPQRWRE